MRPLLLAACLFATKVAAVEPGAPLLLTAGWQAVLEVPDVFAVVVDDARLLGTSDVREGSVTLQGLVPGTTNLWAYAGSRAAPRVLQYPVVVTRFPTLLPFERVLELRVDEQRRVRVEGAERVVVADPSMIRVAQGPDELEVVGRRAGSTTLIAWVAGKPRYLLISVRGGSVIPTADELDEELTEPIDGRVVLRVGERGAFDAPEGLWRFAMKDSAVANVSARPGELVFEGTHVGATRVLWWAANGKPCSRYVVVLPRVGGDPDPVPPPPPPEPPAPQPILPPARVEADL